MNLHKSNTEKECRAILTDSRKYFLESEKGRYVLEPVRRLYGDFKTCYVLGHTPEQGEDVFRILVDGEKIIGFDLQDEAGRFEALNISTYTVQEYERLVTGKMGRLKLAIAIDLSKSDMNVDK
jgi:hypothetical protein